MISDRRKAVLDFRASAFSTVGSAPTGNVSSSGRRASTALAHSSIGVMKLLGHRNLKMTLRYVEVTNEDLGRDYLKAIERAQNQYARLKYVSNQDVGDHPDALEAIAAAFDQLVARVQAVRFDHPDPGRRKKLQRFVERLRRAQSGLPDLSE